MDFAFGYEVVRSYKRLSYTPWHAIAEFVDNSTQAYANNKEALDAAFQKADAGANTLRVSIDYEPDEDVFRVSDNSMGMAENELERAMKVGVPPDITSGRSRYGMGLKTAACWMGDHWTVTTSKLGEASLLSVTVDVEAVASGNSELPYTSVAADADDHFTIVEVTDLHRRFQGRTLGKIKDYLRSMYRKDLMDRRLRLEWRGEELRWEDDGQRFLPDANGNPYKDDLDLVVDGKRIHGWVGVLAKGSRSRAGFSILHAGRVVKGWPESWRPEEVFGQIEGSNDLVNQRVVGEFHLDNFPVTHTKDDILWAKGEEDAVQAAIANEISHLVDVAKTARTRKKSGPGRGPIKAVSNQIQKTVDIAPRSKPDDRPSVVRRQTEESEEMTRRYAPTAPDISGRLFGLSVRAYLSDEESPSAIHLAVPDSLADGETISVVANLRHPFLDDVSTTEALRVYLRTMIIDVLTYANLERWDELGDIVRARDTIMRSWESTEGAG